MVKQFKPMKAVSEKLGFGDLKYPLYASLKIDGVYGLNLDGGLLGRSLKPMKNKWLTEKLSQFEFRGFCGEVSHADSVLGELGLNRQDLCRSTTSNVNTIEGGEFPLLWVLFDFVSDGNEFFCYNNDYVDRMGMLKDILWDYGDYIGNVVSSGITFEHHVMLDVDILVQELKEFKTPEELEAFYLEAVQNGFEGIVARSKDGIFKFGRSTAKSQEIVRFKPEGSSEIIVTEFEPMFENRNEAKINELGHTERSSHKENKFQLEMVGAMIGVDINTGKMTKVGAGKMSHAEREKVWKNQDEYRGKLSKYLFMDTGIKDAPRHPRHDMWRPLTDIEISDEVKSIAQSMGIEIK